MFDFVKKGNFTDDNTLSYNGTDVNNVAKTFEEQIGVLMSFTDNYMQAYPEH